jgi:hypothetical protein
MPGCGSWNPVSLQDPQPYYPDDRLPTVAELKVLDIKSHNMWREKAIRIWLATWQRRWRYKGFSGAQERELVALYRAGRKEIFGDEKSHPEDYHCGSNDHKKSWNMAIDWEASWQASKPDWYKE